MYLKRSCIGKAKGIKALLLDLVIQWMALHCWWHSENSIAVFWMSCFAIFSGLNVETASSQAVSACYGLCFQGLHLPLKKYTGKWIILQLLQCQCWWNWIYSFASKHNANICKHEICRKAKLKCEIVLGSWFCNKKQKTQVSASIFNFTFGTMWIMPLLKKWLLQVLFQ